MHTVYASHWPPLKRSQYQPASKRKFCSPICHPCNATRPPSLTHGLTPLVPNPSETRNLLRPIPPLLLLLPLNLIPKCIIPAPRRLILKPLRPRPVAAIEIVITKLDPAVTSLPTPLGPFPHVVFSVVAHLPPISLALADRAADAESDDDERDEADWKANLETFFCRDGIGHRDSREGVRV